MSGPDLGIERAVITTLSIAHLHPNTRTAIDAVTGEIPEGPSIAVRDECFLINSHLGMPDVLSEDFAAGRHDSLMDRMPDLVLIRALARGLGADWINIDADGVANTDILPSYDDDWTVTLPSGAGWADSLSTIKTLPNDARMVVPTCEVLQMIKAGQTSRLQDETPVIG